MFGQHSLYLMETFGATQLAPESVYYDADVLIVCSLNRFTISGRVRQPTTQVAGDTVHKLLMM